MFYICTYIHLILGLGGLTPFPDPYTINSDSSTRSVATLCMKNSYHNRNKEAHVIYAHSRHLLTSFPVSRLLVFIGCWQHVSG